jgi:hypothetical protein
MVGIQIAELDKRCSLHKINPHLSRIARKQLGHESFSLRARSAL